jgi:hypothetical protein
MEKYFNSFLSIFRLSNLILSKPASLLSFVDPSLFTCNRVKVIYQILPRNGDARSSG